ncbi:hypothetical protein RRG08_010994 [Elysia crispata]|uniref:Uncharacterized protein n=1 Tax=Elysia crispata TaxID=231223 RepID=A0AAE0ZQW0_9GAST|nr:hypothetical protein RRG08_010994 [Elysia crispata]
MVGYNTGTSATFDPLLAKAWCYRATFSLSHYTTGLRAVKRSWTGESTMDISVFATGLSKRRTAPTLKP